jgi:hypothetical protein
MLAQEPFQKEVIENKKEEWRGRRGSNLPTPPATRGNQRHVFESTYVRFGEVATRGNGFLQHVSAMLARRWTEVPLTVQRESAKGLRVIILPGTAPINNSIGYASATRCVKHGHFRPRGVVIRSGNGGGTRRQPGDDLGKGQVAAGRCIPPAFFARLLVHQ